MNDLPRQIEDYTPASEKDLRDAGAPSGRANAVARVQGEIPVIVKYSRQLFARCPSDHEPDVYEVTIESTRTILAEDINAAFDEIGAYEKHQPQEEITVKLARRFAARVTTIGNHYGVRTEVIA